MQPLWPVFFGNTLGPLQTQSRPVWPTRLFRSREIRAGPVSQRV